MIDALSILTKKTKLLTMVYHEIMHSMCFECILKKKQATNFSHVSEYE